MGKIILGAITHASECYLVRRHLLSVNRNLNLNFTGCQYSWCKTEVGGHFRTHVITSHQIFITYETTKLSSILSSIFINLGLLALFHTCSHFYFRVDLIQNSIHKNWNYKSHLHLFLIDVYQHLLEIKNGYKIHTCLLAEKVNFLYHNRSWELYFALSSNEF